MISRLLSKSCRCECSAPNAGACSGARLLLFGLGPVFGVQLLPWRISWRKVRIPQALWVADTQRNPALFNIADPLERYVQVNKFRTTAGVIDLHFQSTRTVTCRWCWTRNCQMSSQLAGKAGRAWVVTGTGHHVAKNTHQKAGVVSTAHPHTRIHLHTSAHTCLLPSV
jgi:hypothetical protein